MSIQKPLTEEEKARQAKYKKAEAKRRAKMTPAQKKRDSTRSIPAPTPKINLLKEFKQGYGK